MDPPFLMWRWFDKELILKKISGHNRSGILFPKKRLRRVLQPFFIDLFPHLPFHTSHVFPDLMNRE